MAGQVLPETFSARRKDSLEAIHLTFGLLQVVSASFTHHLRRTRVAPPTVHAFCDCDRGLTFGACFSSLFSARIAFAP